MHIEVSEVLFTIINVIILCWFLSKKLFVPVTNFMNSRTESIEKRIGESEEMLKQAQAMKAQYEEKLVEADAQGKKIVQEYKDKAINLSDEIIGEAKKEAELIRLRVRNELEREKVKAHDEMRKQIIELSLLAASKAVEVQLDNDNHHVLIQEFISKVGM